MIGPAAIAHSMLQQRVLPTITTPPASGPAQTSHKSGFIISTRKYRPPWLRLPSTMNGIPGTSVGVKPAVTQFQSGGVELPPKPVSRTFEHRIPFHHGSSMRPAMANVALPTHHFAMRQMRHDEAMADGQTLGH